MYRRSPTSRGQGSVDASRTGRRFATTWRTAAWFAALLLVGCKGGATVTVDIDVPRPLVAPLHVTMGVYFDDTLQSYIHREELEDHGAYSIDIGASQAPVFAQVFDAMFDSVVQVRAEVPADDASSADEDAPQEPLAPTFIGIAPGSVDGILAPSIEEVQFAIPDQTGGEFYEVWIRYRIRIYDASGQTLAEWPLIGYGKANERNYRSIDQKEAGLNEATIWALRDAAALLSFQFGDQAEVQDWLAAIGVSNETP